ncbi:hypothetical protein ACFWUW_18115 [Streptomyces sp. NPDC058655]|uniref:hypothetical protein n=1 Tax=unclassified Streptomyces TaxID=2593676 RepID=UPI00365121DF
MYLVHVHLRPPASAPRLPDATARLLILLAEGREAVTHVSVHPDPPTHPVIGLFLRADSLAEAEASAQRLWHHLHHARHPLAAWTLLRAEVPLHPHSSPWATGG